MKNIANMVDLLPDVHRTRVPQEGELQVTAILDEFSAQCFEGVVNLWRPTPLWAVHDQQFIKPDLLLVESAWSGNFSTWRYMVTSGSGPSERLTRLIAECKRLGIPTVFWNKEDPVHFDDFIRTAREFDYVLTTEEDLVTRYKSIEGVKDAALLRFAAEPTLHNPRRLENYRQGDIAFAGMYFTHKYENRRLQMDKLFPAASKYSFSIYSRMYGGDPRYQFPERYAPYIVGSLPYEEMVKAYRQYKVFLNVNSVPESRTMCARRVFELSAAKTAVVGMESEAIRSVYSDDEVLLADSPEQAEDIFDFLIGDDLGRRVTVQKAWRKTLSLHTYENRVAEIMSLLGIGRNAAAVHVHLVLKARQESLSYLLDDISRQRFPLGAELKITWSLETDQQMETRFSKYERMSSIPREADYVCIFTEGFRYGVHYLNDLLLTIRQQKSSVAAKLASNQIADWELLEETLVHTEFPEYGYIYKNSVDVQKMVDEGSGEIYFGDGFGVTVKESADPKILDI